MHKYLALNLSKYLNLKSRIRYFTRYMLKFRMAIEHSQLVLEMPNIEAMSLLERRNLARKRRKDQLKFWASKNKEVEVRRQTRSYKSKVVFNDKILFLEASANNDYHEIKRLLEKGVDPNIKNDDGLTALHQACIDGNDSILTILVKYGADVNVQDNEKWTPLHAAAACNQKKVFRLLVMKGADLLSVNIDGYLPADVCTDNDMYLMIETEMERKGITKQQIEQARSEVESTMLIDMKRIAEEKGNLEYLDSTGASPLHIAAANGYFSVCEFLLNRKVNVNITDSDGWTPAHAACCWTKLDVLQLLINFGADMRITNQRNETPIDVAEPEIRDQILRMKKREFISSPSRGRGRLSTVSSRGTSINRQPVKFRDSISKRDRESERQIKIEAEHNIDKPRHFWSKK